MQKHTRQSDKQAKVKTSVKQLSHEDIHFCNKHIGPDVSLYELSYTNIQLTIGGGKFL